ncbi:2-phospho-L-lactate transferase [Ancylobacter sp. Lp-2]|uniref:2-phospho-L-lactate transferase n=1 Tax=Ancylobacter sp. Lp-2 TaxID=2881339 RepID=UPI001E318741|nr:2-phospho-L-lactate transferase [Ancylobacter sp. Lp-2]MCB4768338.1 2-phospho-L-lactate transferase [Ancylobacter sp. Lp-2]
MTIPEENSRAQVLALCGGIGGAKLALGLYRTLGPGHLTVAVNTGDDFTHLGLHVSPDIDTVAYTLAGLNDTERGWGLAGETWHFMEALGRLGGDTWFQLGDHDLATHVVRTQRLAAGETLSQVTAGLATRLGLHARLLPMSDDPVRTLVDTEEGRLAFQNYFVEHRCRPRVTGISFAGAETAKPQDDVLALLADGTLAAIVICPSNPYLSVDPMLAIPGLREALKASAAPVIAVSPIVGGKAVKGPTAKIMEELGLPVSIRAIADHYRDLIDGFILDDADAADSTGLGIPSVATRTLMETLGDRERLARSVLDFAAGLRRHR